MEKNKNIIKPSILPGFMELLPKEQEIFNDMVKKISEVYEKNGCFSIDTPIIEKAQVLLAKSGGETEKQVYSFQKGKNDLALRFDLTVPFARYVAQYYNDLIFPFKRYQIGKVYRGERSQKGRYREFYQCDVDIIGRNKLSIINDALVISLASKAFKSIGLNQYQFQVSNRKILRGLLEFLEIENSSLVISLIDKFDKIGEVTFRKELDLLIGKEKSKYISDFLNINDDNEKIVDKLKKLNINSAIYNEGIEELEKVIEGLEIFGVVNREFKINLKIIRGLDYYTGTVFETNLVDKEEYGSICSGGRYDNLAENYSENILPGVGISIGLTRLFFILKEIGFIEKYDIKSKLDYLIIPIGNTLLYCSKVMSSLQEKGFGVTINFEDTSLKKKMSYADKIGVENVILIGEDEVVAEKVKIRNMKDGSDIILGWDYFNC